MRRSTARVDPWAADDPALAFALHELHRYRRREREARWGSRLLEFILLLTTASTTLAAALDAAGWTTALLAAFSVVLTGVRSVYGWRESWTSYATAWLGLRAAVHEYRLLPENRRDDNARTRLVRAVDEIVAADISRRASRLLQSPERAGEAQVAGPGPHESTASHSGRSSVG